MKRMSVFLIFLAIILLASCTPITQGADPTATSAPLASSTATATLAPSPTEAATAEPELTGWPQRPENLVSLTLGVADNASIEDWETNAMTLHLEEQLNVDLSFELLPSAGAELVQKVELMVLAGGKDLPDIILHNLGGLANLEKYGQMGILVPVNDYYDTMSYYIDTEGLPSCEMAPLTKEDFLRYITSSDGNIYAMASYMPNTNNMYAPARMMIYYPWLEATGIGMPQTTEDFYNVLIAFRDNDLNGNGNADEIPLMSSKDRVTTNLLRSLMNPFVYTQSNYLINKDGKGVLEFAPIQDGWKEGLKYIRRLFDENLISPLSLTQDQQQLTTLLTQEETVVGAFARISNTNIPASDPRRVEYVGMNPLEGPDGTRQVPAELPYPTPAMVITLNCSDPERAFQLGDYMCSNLMSIWTRYGREGEEWALSDKPGLSNYSALGFQGEITTLNEIWGQSQNVFWAQAGPSIRDDSIFGFRRMAEDQDIAPHLMQGYMVANEKKYANPYPVGGMIFTQEENDVVVEFRSIIEGFVSETFVQFVTGQRDIDSGWDAYLSEYGKMGLDRYMDALQSCWDRMSK